MDMSRGLAKADVSLLAGAEEKEGVLSPEDFPGAEVGTGVILGLRILQRRWEQTRGQP